MPNLDEFEKIDETNIDDIIDEVREFIKLYLFKGNVALNDKAIRDLFEISKEDLITLKAFHFLLSDKVRKLVSILPYLVRNLAHDTKKETEVMRGNIRGRINWGETLKERYSQGFDDKTLFVCNTPLKYYDLEENQLLKFLLKKIIHIKENYLKFIEPEKFDIEKIDKNKDWYTIVNDTVQMSKLTLKKVYFREISNVKIKSKHLRKCMKNRNLYYHIVAEAYELYKKLFILEDMDVLEDLISERIVKTTNHDKLYEIYVFFYLIKSLPGTWEGKLLYSGNDYSTSCIDGDLKITIHYQFTPSALSKNSYYDDILDNYVINNHIRSPDIIIEFNYKNKTFYRLVEVKNTSKTGYVRDSVYKVMGYYQDFKKISLEENFDFIKNYPIVLVTWGGIKIKDNHYPFDGDKIIILNRIEFINNLKKLLKFEC